MGFIYLIRDESLPYTKIGWARNPSLRERTLQAEKPTFVLAGAWEGNKAIERELHVRFASRRIRGEWFDLSADDVASVEGIISGMRAAAEESARQEDSKRPSCGYRHDKIRTAMEARGLTCEALGKRTGIAPGTIAAIQFGTLYNLRLYTLRELADALGLAMAELFEPESEVA